MLDNILINDNNNFSYNKTIAIRMHTKQTNIFLRPAKHVISFASKTVNNIISESRKKHIESLNKKIRKTKGYLEELREALDRSESMYRYYDMDVINNDFYKYEDKKGNMDWEAFRSKDRELKDLRRSWSIRKQEIKLEYERIGKKYNRLVEARKKLLKTEN